MPRYIYIDITAYIYRLIVTASVISYLPITNIEPKASCVLNSLYSSLNGKYLELIWGLIGGHQYPTKGFQYQAVGLGFPVKSLLKTVI